MRSASVRVLCLRRAALSARSCSLCSEMIFLANFSCFLRITAISNSTFLVSSSLQVSGSTRIMIDCPMASSQIISRAVLLAFLMS